MSVSDGFVEAAKDDAPKHFLAIRLRHPAGAFKMLLRILTQRPVVVFEETDDGLFAGQLHDLLQAVQCCRSDLGSWILSGFNEDRHTESLTDRSQRFGAQTSNIERHL